MKVIVDDDVVDDDVVDDDVVVDDVVVDDVVVDDVVDDDKTTTKLITSIFPSVKLNLYLSKWMTDFPFCRVFPG